MFCIPLMCDGRPVYTLNMRCTARRPYCGTGLHYHYTHVPPRSNYPTRQRKCQPPNVYQCDEVMEINSRPPTLPPPTHLFCSLLCSSVCIPSWCLSVLCFPSLSVAFIPCLFISTPAVICPPNTRRGRRMPCQI